MMNVTQCLWFDRDMDAALRLYTSLIPGSSLDWNSALAADSPGGPAGSVRIAGFTLGGQRYMAFECGRPEGFTHASSILVECDTQEEIDRLWERLGDGGQIEQCGWLRDRWGLAWQIQPKRLRELMDGPDRAAAKRVAEAMLQMVKLDIAALEKAAKG
ncbi:MAG TPA: VOC family protein [Ferrovibrio sp.]|uniref:VOC family protein n=1 Tax=Ferrovibrio sp. TaxID=1917215 RepID=UPI002B4AB252|nr:VOC family protein [Ferrovibrio sp.]HLT77416.1 VOC family protein [Ferrovibrio sp.]